MNSSLRRSPLWRLAVRRRPNITHLNSIRSIWTNRTKVESHFLPFEIHLLILDCSTPALSLLLVCRAWLPRAKSLLYARTTPRSLSDLKHLVRNVTIYEDIGPSIRTLIFPLFLIGSFDSRTSVCECPYYGETRKPLTETRSTEDSVTQPLAKKWVRLRMSDLLRLCEMFQIVLGRCTRLVDLQVPHAVLHHHISSSRHTSLDINMQGIRRLSLIALVRGETLRVNWVEFGRLFPDLEILRLNNFTLDFMNSESKALPYGLESPMNALAQNSMARLRTLHIRACTIIPRPSTSPLLGAAPHSLRTLAIDGGLGSSDRPCDVQRLTQIDHLALEAWKFKSSTSRYKTLSGLKTLTVIYDWLDFCDD